VNYGYAKMIGISKDGKIFRDTMLDTNQKMNRMKPVIYNVGQKNKILEEAKRLSGGI
jgi:hypothetical protein